MVYLMVILIVCIMSCNNREKIFGLAQKQFEALTILLYYIMFSTHDLCALMY